MYKHILVPTDGSALSMKAVRAAAGLARELKARITALYVMPESSGFYVDGTAAGHEIVDKRFREFNEQAGKKALAAAEIEASTSSVPYDGMLVAGEYPWKEIARVASSKKCDLIVMASHGRKGIEGLLLGSETMKVLTHSKTPVLVCR